MVSGLNVHYDLQTFESFDGDMALKLDCALFDTTYDNIFVGLRRYRRGIKKRGERVAMSFIDFGISGC